MDAIISIIIPVYNAEEYIDKCLNSVLNQSFNDYEIIIINDGSTDTSGEICRHYLSVTSQIKYIDQENKGVCHARNIGLEEAKGELVFFMDADDWLEDGSLELLYEEYKRTGSDLIVANMRFVSINSSKDIHVFDKDFTTEDISWIDQYEMACIGYGYNPNPGTKHNITGLGSMGNKLYKREIIEKNRIRFDPYTLGIYEDNLFVLKYLLHVRRMSYISKVVYNYRSVSDSNSRGYKGNTLEINNRVFESIQKYISMYKKGNEERYQKAFYMYVIRRFDDALSVYFFSPGNKNSFSSKLNELGLIINSEIYSEAIGKVDLKRLKTKHKITCILAKTGKPIIIWMWYKVRNAVLKIVALLRYCNYLAKSHHN